jgi:hypothetical protein
MALGCKFPLDDEVTARKAIKIFFDGYLSTAAHGFFSRETKNYACNKKEFFTAVRTPHFAW